MATITTQRKKASYFREVQNELKKVTWTSKGELLLSTKVVVIAIFVFGLGIYFCDLTVRGAINALGMFVRMIFS